MPIPQADPILVSRTMLAGINMCIARLMATHAHIEAKFLKDLADSIDMLQMKGEFQLDRPVEAMDIESRRKFIQHVSQNCEVISSIFGTPSQAVIDQASTGALPPAIVGLQTMFVLNLAKFCKAQNVPYIGPRV